MSEDPKVAANRISVADIDAVFANVTGDPGISAVEQQTEEKHHKSGDDQKTELHKSSHSDQALKINWNHQESEVDAEDKSSGTMANTKLADSPINMAETGNNRDEKVENLEIGLNSDSSSVQSGVTGVKYQSSMANENSASHLLGSSSQSSEETASISIYRKSLHVLYQDPDDIFLLNFIIQILRNFRRLRDEFLERRPVCSQPSHEGPCIADILYEIFSALEKNDRQRIFYMPNFK